MARGKKVEPMPGADTLTGELWAGKKGVGTVRGRMGVEDAKLIMAFAVLPFDHGVLLERITPSLPWVASIYQRYPDEAQAIMRAVSAHMKGRRKTARVVAAHPGLTAAQLADKAGVCDEEGPTKARKRLRRAMKELRKDEHRRRQSGDTNSVS